MKKAMEFENFISSAKIFDAEYFGSAFTWCNNRNGNAKIWKRMDRLLLDGAWLDQGLVTSVTHLARNFSDHSLL